MFNFSVNTQKAVRPAIRIRSDTNELKQTRLAADAEA